MHLDIQRNNKNSRYEVQYIGGLPGKAIFITAPVINGLPVTVPLTSRCAVRFVSGKDIYAFRADVREVYSKPFHHICLAYPEKIECVAIRKSERVVVFLETSILVVGGDGSEVTGMIKNLSISGALLACEKSLGDLDIEVTLKFNLPFAGTDFYLTIEGNIRNMGHVKDDSDIDHSKRRYGVNFKDIDDQTRILLHGYICEQQANNRLSDAAKG